MKHFALIVCCLLFSAVSFAGVTVNYTLDGNYVVQISRSKFVEWTATSTCVDSNGNKHKATGGGGDNPVNAIYGTANFNGSSGVTFDVTVAGTFNQDASNDTVVITWSTDGTCTLISVNDGYAVYDAPVPASATGTYSLTTDTTTGVGTGAITVTIGPEIESFGFLATGANVQCIVGSTENVVLSNIMLTAGSSKTPYKVVYAGTAQHTNAYVNPCPSGSSKLAR